MPAANPINGTPKLKFGLYSTEFDATPIWEETHITATVTNGYFTVLLGSVTPLNTTAFGNATRWLQVSVDTGSGYTDLPRQRVTSAPFALQAANADTLDGQHASAFASSSTLGCRMIATISQTIPSKTFIELSFDTVISDTNNCWSATYPTRLYARTAGYYMMGGQVSFKYTDVDSAARVWILIKSSRGEHYYLQSNDTHTTPGQGVSPSVSTGMVYMNPGEYIELQVWHSFNDEKNTSDAGSTTSQHAVTGWLMKIN